MSGFFNVLTKDSQTAARTGLIHTPHGDVRTPSYVIVGTDAAVRCLEPEDIPKTETQMIIANTYHLWRALGDAGLQEYRGLHAEMGWRGPLMTDSGGFQVFSLGAAREHGVGKVSSDPQKPSTGVISHEANVFRSDPSSVRITESGVYFMEGGVEQYLDAELSMRIQEELGADIIFAFDEPSSPYHDYEYTKKAMERTHRWAERSLEAKSPKQRIYGIVQGGMFEDLRRESAKYIGELPFDGLALGGAFGSSFGSTSEVTRKELSWTIPFLPKEKPRHLLGMGKIEDLFDGVEQGIDTFDCVIPTREARHGAIWTARGRYDVTRGRYGTEEPLEECCGCPACFEMTVSRADLKKLFQEKDLRAGRIATLHNIYFFNTVMSQIRQAIEEGRFSQFKKEYLTKLRVS